MYFTWDFGRVGEGVRGMVRDVEEEERWKEWDRDRGRGGDGESDEDGEGVLGEETRRARNERMLSDPLMQTFPPLLWAPPGKSQIFFSLVCLGVRS